MAKYEMKMMFDWGSDSCIWSTNDAALQLYGTSVLLDQLPISYQLKAMLNRLIIRHDQALDWECPQNDLLWNEKQIKSFEKEVIAAYKQLCVELGENYEIALGEIM